MNKTHDSKRHPTPPNLLRGILLLSVGITSMILAIAWFIVNQQVEKLVIKRTSEYAHSIARIAADSSAEALLSEDQLQLNLLVENVAKDPFIVQATIYSEDGQVVAQYPEKNIQPILDQSNANANDAIADIEDSQHALSNNSKKLSDQFIRQSKNIPIIEQIVYQNITAGWFKLEVDRALLEQDLRDAYFDIQVITGSVSAVLFGILIFFVFKLEFNIKRLAISCQHLLLQRKIIPPKNKQQWLNAVATLSQSHNQQLKESVILPAKTERWFNSKITQQTLVCYLEFEVQQIDETQMATNLSLAENYLNKAIQSYGIQSQGDILSGCLIPFFNDDSNDSSKQKQLGDAISFIELIRKLMGKLPLEIKVKICISRSSLLFLEDRHDLITGLALVGSSQTKVRQAMQIIEYGEMVSVAITEEMLAPFIESQIKLDGDLSINNKLTKLSGVTAAIQTQISRKFAYITNS